MRWPRRRSRVREASRRVGTRAPRDLPRATHAPPLSEGDTIAVSSAQLRLRVLEAHAGYIRLGFTPPTDRTGHGGLDGSTATAIVTAALESAIRSAVPGHLVRLSRVAVDIIGPIETQSGPLYCEARSLHRGLGTATGTASIRPPGSSAPLARATATMLMLPP